MKRKCCATPRTFGCTKTLEKTAMNESLYISWIIIFPVYFYEKISLADFYINVFFKIWYYFLFFSQ